MHQRSLSLLLLLLVFIFSACGKKDSNPILDEDRRNFELNKAFFANQEIKVSLYAKKGLRAANEIIPCVRELENLECTLKELPLLRMDYQDPTVDQIMERVVVSDRWMGDRFKTILKRQKNGDLRKLLGAVTAIVISRGIRPSFYSSSRGAIYLDPRYLWLSEEEKEQTSPKVKDSRSDYAREVTVESSSFYSKEAKIVSLPKTVEERSLKIIEPHLVRLLYHELAHANDFFPATQDQKMLADTSRTLASYRMEFYNNDELISDRMPNKLYSGTLKELANVLFYGEKANESQKNMTAEIFLLFFEDDYAVDFYGYATRREDLAMSFEILMMYKRHGMETISYVLDNPTTIEKGYRYPVEWAVKNRIFRDPILEKALFVASELLPDVDMQDLERDHPVPTEIPKGTSYFDLVKF